MMLSQLLQVGRFISASNFRRGIHRITDEEEDAAGDDWDDEDMEEEDE